MKKFIVIFFCLISVLQGGVTGKIVGVVRDAYTSQPLIGANIEVISKTLTGAATDLDGTFMILNLPPDYYQIRVSYMGYETTIVENVRVVVDQATTLSIKLGPSTITGEEVVIIAENPLVQKDLTSTISVVRREEIENLPVTNFSELLSLQAGVIGSGSNLHIRGGRSNEIAFLIDGMYVRDPLLGGLATEINNDAIQEMSLLSGTFNAEYGNALSGVVNIITRDGGENLGGKFEGRTSQFGVSRYAEYDRSRINGYIGGPLITQNVKFFISGESFERGSYLPFGYNDIMTGFAKVSILLPGNLKLTWSNRASKEKRQGYYHSWKYIPEQYLRIRTDSYQSILTLTHSITPKFFYDLRVSYFNQGYYSGIDKDTSAYLASSQRQYLSAAGNGFEFWEKADPVELTDSRTVTADLKADFVWQLNKIHEIKFGYQYLQHRIRLFYVYDPKRNFPYINDYTTEPLESAGYVQDKIEFPFLVINLGLRFDYMNANTTFRKDPLDPNSLVKVDSRQQLSPRVGIAHPISEKTKLHFSYGHFFQNPDFQFLFENQQYDLNVREPLFGQADLDAERTVSYEVGLAHQFSPRMALSLTAFYRDVTGLIGTRYYQAFSQGRYVGYTLYVNEDYANIRGLELNIDLRPGRYLSGGLNYSYQIAKGSASSETEQYPGTEESTKLYFLDFDQTHVFNVNGTLVIPKDRGPSLFNWKIFGNTDMSLILRFNSGYPYTPSGRDIGFVDKNSLRRPTNYTLDMEIGKAFKFYKQAKMRIFVEVLNLTDHRNIIYVYPDTGDPDFTFVGDPSEEYMKDPSNYGPPRTISLGASVIF